MEKRIKLTTEFQWLNKKGQLHSVNDMPAHIDDIGVYWYYKGVMMRFYSLTIGELPCHISNAGEMTFLRRKNDIAESVKFPFSTKHYGEVAKIGLKYYEKYVDWPIRSLLTV